MYVRAYVRFFCYKFFLIWNIVISTATLRGNPSKLRSHACANNKYLPLKMQINSIFIVKSLCIPNICSNFAPDFMYIARKGTGFVCKKVGNNGRDSTHRAV